MAVESRRVAVLIESAHRLLRRGALSNVQRLLSKAHEADVAILFRHLAPAERATVFGALESRLRKAEVMSELDREIQVALLQELGAAEAVAILEEMDRDDVADLLRSLPPEFSEELLGRMKREESIQVEGLLGYEEDTAGGIMSPEFLALREETSVEEAIEACRAGEDFEMVFYVYVVNEFGHLVGVVSLRQLVTAAAKTLLKDIMETDAVRVRAHTPSSEVAKLVARYNFLALPVVDEANRLIGIVTVDDVIDVIREEATEGMLRVVGAGDDIDESRRFAANLRARLPWLVVAVIGGLVTVPIIGSLGGEPSHLFWRFFLFVPLVLGLGGNLGIQSFTLVERQLSAGTYPEASLSLALLREVGVGTAFGLFSALVVGLVASAYGLGWPMAVSVGAGALASSLLATLIGASVAHTMHRLKPGSAFASGPLVKALCDALLLLAFLGTSGLILGALVPGDVWPRW